MQGPYLIALCGCPFQGPEHIGGHAMVNYLRLFIPDLRNVVRTFVSLSLLCPHAKNDTLECNKRNGILHWAFLSIVCDSTDGSVAVAAILKYHSRFGDQPV
ncbi:hypothetical protein PHMEG_00021201 [Phytophthora megakarya]|uniref:Uncharacterized protein n=1 Tax=Phytophthora megakarya TaxID=4795 RepID=A0A225VMH2_9STRA|nr:hypothetical protein PHMEG_00021201 [Phytophthora megakarya]